MCMLNQAEFAWARFGRSGHGDWVASSKRFSAVALILHRRLALSVGDNRRLFLNDSRCKTINEGEVEATDQV